MDKDPVTESPELQKYQGLIDKYRSLASLPIQGLTELETWFDMQVTLMREINVAGYTWHQVMDAR